MTMKIKQPDGGPIKITPELRDMLRQRLGERRQKLIVERENKLKSGQYKPIMEQLYLLNRDYYAKVTEIDKAYKKLKAQVSKMSGSKDRLSYYSDPKNAWPSNYKPLIEFGDNHQFDIDAKYRSIAVRLQYEKSVDIDTILKQIDTME